MAKYFRLPILYGIYHRLPGALPSFSRVWFVRRTHNFEALKGQPPSVRGLITGESLRVHRRISELFC